MRFPRAPILQLFPLPTHHIHPIRRKMSSQAPIPHTLPLPGGIPDTHRPHTESTTTILVHKDNTAFLNPVQQYNRDLSIACIRGWNELRKEEAEERWRRKQERMKETGKGKGKGKGKKVDGQEQAEEGGEGGKEEVVAGPSKEVSLHLTSVLGRKSLPQAASARRADEGRGRTRRKSSPSSKLSVLPVCVLSDTQKRSLTSGTLAHRTPWPSSGPSADTVAMSWQTTFHLLHVMQCA